MITGLMKHLRILVIAAIAGAALPAVIGASPAAAETILCTEKTTECPASKTDGVGTEIKLSLVSGVKSKLTTAYNNIECGKSSFTAKVTATGEQISASVETLTFEECNCEVKVLAKGTLGLAQIAGTHNATVTSTGTEVTTSCETVFGNVHCIYQTNATDLGTLEGGNPAKLKISGAAIPRLATNERCAEAANWDAEYEATSPKPLYIEPGAINETALCTEKATPCPALKTDGVGTEIKASLVSGTKSKLTTPYNNIECSKSSLTAKVTSAGKTIGSSVEALTFEECNCEVKVLAKGTLELAHIAGSENATVTSTGTEVTTICSTLFGNVHCIYKTEGTDLGTVEGGSPGRFKVAENSISRPPTNAHCAEGAQWDAEYEVTSPSPLYIEPEAVIPAGAVLCTEKATPCPTGKADGVGTEIKLSSSATSKLTTSFKNIECTNSSITALVTRTAERTNASVEGLSFESCNCTVNVLKKGTLMLERISGTDNATVTSTGTEVTTTCSTIFGTIHCIYKTEATDLGTLTGGATAKLDISSANIPRLVTNAICAEKANWDVEYEVTSPKPLYIEPE